MQLKRIYEVFLQQHYERYEQMLFLVGARQVGKTTIARALQQRKTTVYLNWDIIEDRQQILSGQKFIEKHLPINMLRTDKPLVIFDEIHKYNNWKNYLKGFYDLYKDHYVILVTGSSRLDVFQTGGDSLMGRYFQYRVHPLSVKECIIQHEPQIVTINNEVSNPSFLSEQDFNNLYMFGGFPKVFIEADPRFFKRWQNIRSRQLLHEDIRTLTQLQEIAQLEILSELLKLQAGQILNRSSLSKKIQVTVQTINRWIETLERFYYCFLVTPWYKNISRSLIKEPKVYLSDWSIIDDPGMRFENFIAAHLLKAVHLWNDLGIGNYSLHYLRDKDQREVDFVVVKDQQPWFLVEAKLSNNQGISPALLHFQKQTKALHAFQVVFDLKYVNNSCFTYNTPYIVPARTFLSQLV